MKARMHVLAVLALISGFTSSTLAAEKHLFYINGCCVHGPSDDKADAYEKIANNLRESGLNVVFEMRYDDSNERIQQDVEKVTGQVKALLANGTAPEDITVSGYSLGSAMTLFAAIAIANPKVNYVLLAGCPGPNARHFDIDYARVEGRVLAITETNDDRFGSCAGKFSPAVTFKEVTLDSGEGHKLFRIARDSQIRLWKEPLQAWVR